MSLTMLGKSLELFIFVFVVTITIVQCEFNLVLLHTNDMHARFEETNAHSGKLRPGEGTGYGGFARLKTAVDKSREKAREEGYSSIFLNAGDTFQGTVFYTMFKWRVVSELTNMLGIDVMSLGNHEFDDGPQGLAPFLANSSVPVVCANLDYSKEPILASDPDIIKPPKRSHVLVVNGVRIGVVGYLTPETKFLSNIGKVELRDEIEALKEEVGRLKKDGVKIIIALGHSGYKTDKKIAEQVPDLDVVVGGHTNTFLYTGKAPNIEKVDGPYPTVVRQPSGREVLVVQAYAYTKYLGNLKLTFDDQGEIVKRGGNPILVDETFPKDDLERIVRKYEEQVQEKAGMKIGSSKTFLEADAVCRIRECNIGNLVADAMVHANAKDFRDPLGKGWTDAPIAFIQGGALRTSINAGDITYQDLLTTLPFINTVERLVLTGSVLSQVLEHSVSRYDLEERGGWFLQFSGIHVEYDLSKPLGQRVVSAKVRCGNCSVPQYYPLKPSKQYHVLTITYLTEGGDGFSMLKKALDKKTLSFTDVDAVQNYLIEKSPVHPEIEGRVKLIGTPSQRSTAPSLSNSLLTTFVCLSALKIIPFLNS